MKANEFIIVELKQDRKQPAKTRNPVAKNLSVTASGAGAHKDKKRDAKTGVEKHKKDYAMSEAKLGAGKVEESSPMIKPPRNRFDSKQEAFAYARENGGKVFKSTYTDPNTGRDSVAFVVKKDLGAKFDEGNMSPQQQHDFDRMRYGAMSRKEYHAKYKQPRKSDAEVMHRKRKNTEEAYDGEPNEYFVLRHRSKRDIENEITVTRLWSKIKQFDSYQQAIRARDEMTAKHPGERFTVTTHKKPSATEGYAGVDDTDTVGFSVNTEAAYTAVMKRFGDVIDHDETTGIMYAPAGVWPRIEMVAFDADGEGAVRDDGVAENDRSEMDTPEFQRALSSVKKKAAQGPMTTVYDPKTRKYKVVPVNTQGK